MQKVTNTLYQYISPVIQYKGYIAGFDLDWTLIRPNSSQFPKNSEDVLFMPNRIETLKNYQKNGYLNIIFTNQKVTKRYTIDFRINYLNNVIRILEQNELNTLILMSTGEDSFRKPNIGMWQYLIQYVKPGYTFYCGDAAGRERDFSDSDKKFAENIEIQFYTPEEIFM